MTTVEVKYLDLNGGISKVNIGPESKTHTMYAHFVKHMTSQLLTHGRIGAEINIYIDNEKNLWGDVGRKIGEEVGNALKSRKNAYGCASSMVGFENAFSISSVRISDKPKAKTFISYESRKYSEFIQHANEYLENFANGGNLEIYAIALRARDLFTRQKEERIFCADFTDWHHVIEDLFKSTGYSLHYAKSMSDQTLVQLPTKPRERYSHIRRGTHETQGYMSATIDGKGIYTNAGLDITVPSEAMEIFEFCDDVFVRAGRFNITRKGKGQEKFKGDDEHHTTEDEGIIKGDVTSRPLNREGGRKGLFRFGYDISYCPECGVTVIVTTDVPGVERNNLTYSLLVIDKDIDTPYLLSHHLKSMGRKGGMDTFVGERIRFDESIPEDLYPLIKSLIDPSSPDFQQFNLAANSIKGTYEITTKCDDPKHRFELITAPYARSLKHSMTINANQQNVASTKEIQDD